MINHGLEQGGKVKWGFFLASVCAIACFLALQILLPCDMLQKLIPGFPTFSNLTAYILTLFLFVALFCVFLAVFRIFRPEKLGDMLEKPMSAKGYAITFAAGSAVLLLLLATRRMVFEKTEYAIANYASAFNQLPPWLGVPLFVIVAAFAAVFVLKLREGWDVSRRVLYLSTAAILVLNFVTVLVMNVFSGSIHHGVAYLESIYNVFYGIPYTHTTVGIYGFYGLFLAPILHIFGGSNFALLLTMALLQTLVVALCIHCVWSLAEENYIRIVAVLLCCISTLSMRVNNYWQLQPHRVLWPLLLTVYVLRLVKKNRWNAWSVLWGYSICTAAVVWNVESGFFCGVAFAAACVVHDWQHNVW